MESPHNVADPTTTKMGPSFFTGGRISLPVAMSTEDKIRRQLEIQNKTVANIVIPATAITVNTC